MLKLLTNSSRIERLTCRDYYHPSTCSSLFPGGYEVDSNSGLGALEYDYALILESGIILYDWTSHSRYDDDGDETNYIISDGVEYNEDDIVYEVDPAELDNLFITRSEKKPVLVTIDGGKTENETPGIRLIRNNMKAWATRSKKLYQERQSRNKKVR